MPVKLGLDTPQSAVPGIDWPSIPAPAAASQLAVQWQLDHSQWWPLPRLRGYQLLQLRGLLAHAYRTIPWYQQHWSRAAYEPGAELEWDLFHRLPLLTRTDIQTAGNALHSRGIPPEHGQVRHRSTSGSTGTPVHAWATDISQLFTTAFTLRDHCWHRRDLSARLAVIHTLADGRTGSNWGAGTAGIFQTGPVVTMNIRNDIATQADWLARQEPVYLLSHPSNIRELARYCLEQEITLPTLREVVTFGELLAAETRDLARQAWDVEIKDVYSSEESGTMALQCPEGEHYHVQAEGYYLEVLHRDGRHCTAGETGQVVVTALHNLAMPLIRYAIGDYAEVGEDCPCGRGLPVLKRILGRSRNMLTLPDGTRHWPSFPTRTWLKIAPIRQLQLEQDRPDHIQVRLVADAPLSTHQQSQLIDVLRESLGYPFNITLELLEQIPRTANAKFEDFISRIDV